MSEAASELARILAVAQAQRPDPAGWSLAVNVDWLERSYFGPGVSRRVDALPTGELGGCVSVRIAGSDEPGAVTVTSMLRPGMEHLWAAQLAWIEAQLEAMASSTIRVVSECLSDAEVLRWGAAGYDLVFEEVAMQRDLSGANAPPPAAWPQGTTRRSKSVI